jgi:hypothetical protein
VPPVSPRRGVDHPPLASLGSPRVDLPSVMSKIHPVKEPLGNSSLQLIPVEPEGFRPVMESPRFVQGATPTDVVRGILRRTPGSAGSEYGSQLKRRRGELIGSDKSALFDASLQSGGSLKRHAGELTELPVPVVSEEVRRVLETLNYLASPVVHALARRDRLREGGYEGRARRRRRVARSPLRRRRVRDAYEDGFDDDDDEDELEEEEEEEIERDVSDELPTTSLSGQVPVQVSRSKKGRSVKRRGGVKEGAKKPKKKQARKNEEQDEDDDEDEDEEDGGQLTHNEQSAPILAEEKTKPPQTESTFALPAAAPVKTAAPALDAAKFGDGGFESSSFQGAGFSSTGFEGASGAFTGTFGSGAGFGEPEKASSSSAAAAPAAFGGFGFGSDEKKQTEDDDTGSSIRKATNGLNNDIAKTASPTSFSFDKSSFDKPVSSPSVQPVDFSLGATEINEQTKAVVAKPDAENPASGVTFSFEFGSKSDNSSFAAPSSNKPISFGGFGDDEEEDETSKIAAKRDKLEEGILAKAKKAKEERLAQGFGMGGGAAPSADSGVPSFAFGVETSLKVGVVLFVDVEVEVFFVGF